MHLTAHTDYALRTLIYLGVRGDRLTTVSEIADAYGISRNHLTKVAARLVAGGYVEALRGNGGGIRLARDPAAINLGEVVRFTETEMNLVECFCTDGHCRIETACLLRSVLRSALAAFLAVLDRYTLAQLLASSPLLEELFAAAPPGS
jgi:Rrf2 family transcriptional regulator, nitric oxide-sensitive transcriptional repressor